MTQNKYATIRDFIYYYTILSTKGNNDTNKSKKTA